MGAAEREYVYILWKNLDEESRPDTFGQEVRGVEERYQHDHVGLGD